MGDDDSVYKYSDFGFIGFDLWQVKGGTIFDNIIITDDAAEADSFTKKWKELSEVEKSKKKEERIPRRRMTKRRRTRTTTTMMPMRTKPTQKICDHRCFS